MDKLMQAVNALKGDLGRTENAYLSLRKKFVKFNDTDPEEYQGYFLAEILNPSPATYICTTEEFNNLVAELSAAEWIK
jgi:hypothetical protein